MGATNEADAHNNMTPPTVPQARRYLRARVSFDAEAWLARRDGPTRVRGRLAVVGAGGALLELGENYAIGSLLRLWFSLPGFRVMECQAIVRNGLPGQGVGVEFLDLESDDQALIKAFVERVQGFATPQVYRDANLKTQSAEEIN